MKRTDVRVLSIAVLTMLMLFLTSCRIQIKVTDSSGKTHLFPNSDQTSDNRAIATGGIQKSGRYVNGH